MDDILVIILIFVLCFGCEMKIPYSMDGIKHEFIINPGK